MQCNGSSSHGLYGGGEGFHTSQRPPLVETSMPTSHRSLSQDANNIQSHTQNMTSRKKNPEMRMLGSSPGGNVNNAEFLPVQFLPNLCMSRGFQSDALCPQVDCGTNQFHPPSLSKELGEPSMNCVRNGPVCSPTNTSFANLLGQFRNKQGQLLSDVHFPNGNLHQRQKVLLNGNIPQSIQLHPCHAGTLMHRTGSSSEPIMDAFEPSQLGYPQENIDEKTIPGAEKSCNTLSNRSEVMKSRWKPNPVQITLLEQHFNSGYTRPTPELHASVQGSGEATENQVAVWLKNRSSRCKRPPTKKSMNAQLHENDSDEDTPWEDFQETSSTILREITSVLGSVNRADVQVLTSAITNARNICSYGVGAESYTMKGFASNLHHLGFNSYYSGDTNTPPFDSSGLALVNLGIEIKLRASAFIEEALNANAKVIAFTSQKAEDISLNCHIVQIPVHSIVGDSIDGEVISSTSEPSSSSFLDPPTLYDRTLELLFECVSIMLKQSIGATPSEMRARHTNLE
eukprot:g5925.t1